MDGEIGLPFIARNGHYERRPETVHISKIDPIRKISEKITPPLNGSRPDSADVALQNEYVSVYGILEHELVKYGNISFHYISPQIGHSGKSILMSIFYVILSLHLRREK